MLVFIALLTLSSFLAAAPTAILLLADRFELVREFAPAWLDRFDIRQITWRNFYSYILFASLRGWWKMASAPKVAARNVDVSRVVCLPADVANVPAYLDFGLYTVPMQDERHPHDVSPLSLPERERTAMQVPAFLQIVRNNRTSVADELADATDKVGQLARRAMTASASLASRTYSSIGSAAGAVADDAVASARAKFLSIFPRASAADEQPEADNTAASAGPPLLAGEDGKGEAGAAADTTRADEAKAKALAGGRAGKTQRPPIPYVRPLDETANVDVYTAEMILSMLDGKTLTPLTVPNSVASAQAVGASAAAAASADIDHDTRVNRMKADLAHDLASFANYAVVDTHLGGSVYKSADDAIRYVLSSDNLAACVTRLTILQERRRRSVPPDAEFPLASFTGQKYAEVKSHITRVELLIRRDAARAIDLFRHGASCARGSTGHTASCCYIAARARMCCILADAETVDRYAHAYYEAAHSRSVTGVVALHAALDNAFADLSQRPDYAEAFMRQTAAIGDKDGDASDWRKFLGVPNNTPPTSKAAIILDAWNGITYMHDNIAYVPHILVNYEDLYHVRVVSGGQAVAGSWRQELRPNATVHFDITGVIYPVVYGESNAVEELLHKLAFPRSLADVGVADIALNVAQAFGVRTLSSSESLGANVAFAIAAHALGDEHPAVGDLQTLRPLSKAPVLSAALAVSGPAYKRNSFVQALAAGACRVQGSLPDHYKEALVGAGLCQLDTAGKMTTVNFGRPLTPQEYIMGGIAALALSGVVNYRREFVHEGDDKAKKKKPGGAAAAAASSAPAPKAISDVPAPQHATEGRGGSAPSAPPLAPGAIGKLDGVITNIRQKGTKTSGGKMSWLDFTDGTLANTALDTVHNTVRASRHQAHKLEQAFPIVAAAFKSLADSYQAAFTGKTNEVLHDAAMHSAGFFNERQTQLRAAANGRTAEERRILAAIVEADQQGYNLFDNAAPIPTTLIVDGKPIDVLAFCSSIGCDFMVLDGRESNGAVRITSVANVKRDWKPANPGSALAASSGAAPAASSGPASASASAPKHRLRGSLSAPARQPIKLEDLDKERLAALDETLRKHLGVSEEAYKRDGYGTRLRIVASQWGLDHLQWAISDKSLRDIFRIVDTASFERGIRKHRNIIDSLRRSGTVSGGKAGASSAGAGLVDLGTEDVLGSTTYRVKTVRGEMDAEDYLRSRIVGSMALAGSGGGGAGRRNAGSGRTGGRNSGHVDDEIDGDDHDDFDVDSEERQFYDRHGIVVDTAEADGLDFECVNLIDVVVCVGEEFEHEAIIAKFKQPVATAPPFTTGTVVAVTPHGSTTTRYFNSNVYVQGGEGIRAIVMPLDSLVSVADLKAGKTDLDLNFEYTLTFTADHPHSAASVSAKIKAHQVYVYARSLSSAGGRTPAKAGCIAIRNFLPGPVYANVASSSLVATARTRFGAMIATRPPQVVTTGSFNGDYITHTADTQHGSCGSPVYADKSVIGVHVGFSRASGTTINLAIVLGEFMPAVEVVDHEAIVNGFTYEHELFLGPEYSVQYTPHVLFQAGKPPLDNHFRHSPTGPYPNAERTESEYMAVGPVVNETHAMIPPTAATISAEEAYGVDAPAPDAAFLESAKRHIGRIIRGFERFADSQGLRRLTRLCPLETATAYSIFAWSRDSSDCSMHARLHLDAQGDPTKKHLVYMILTMPYAEGKAKFMKMVEVGVNGHHFLSTTKGDGAPVHIYGKFQPLSLEKVHQDRHRTIKCVSAEIGITQVALTSFAHKSEAFQKPDQLYDQARAFALEHGHAPSINDLVPTFQSFDNVVALNVAFEPDLPYILGAPVGERLRHFTNKHGLPARDQRSFLSKFMGADVKAWDKTIPRALCVFLMQRLVDNDTIGASLNRACNEAPVYIYKGLFGVPPKDSWCSGNLATLLGNSIMHAAILRAGGFTHFLVAGDDSIVFGRAKAGPKLIDAYCQAGLLTKKVDIGETTFCKHDALFENGRVLIRVCLADIIRNATLMTELTPADIVGLTTYVDAIHPGDCDAIATISLDLAEKFKPLEKAR